ncbi:hypothetical protein BHAP_0815 [Bifidobacterium hapali]|uniref:Uncharacterized protein n=1 Tax=Bifidobacterium hapali TaxID=1630172 RepID=A0A261G0H0_9BIFI|nr:hypothetical protein BHAP_0815 [Bifidobacterium hapali]
MMVRVTDFMMRVADLTVAVRSMHEQIIQQCTDYMLPSRGFEQDRDHADIAIAVTQHDIDHEREIGEPGDWSDPYLETLVVLRAIAEKGPSLGRVLFHGATIEYDGRAYIFTAPSGTGKTTHIRMWRKVFGSKVDIINGDKPLLHIDESSGEVRAFGTPWAGKENWQRNVSAPLAGICVVTRAVDDGSYPTDMGVRVVSGGGGGASAVDAADDADNNVIRVADEHGVENSCRRIGVDRALPLVMRQMYRPDDALAAAESLGLLDALLRHVPVYLLSCTISEAAVLASSKAML